MAKLCAYLVAVAVALPLSVRFAHAAEEPVKNKPVTYANPEDAKYNEVVLGVSKAVLLGSPDKAPYGAFTKFVPGLDAACIRVRSIFLLASTR